MMPPFLSIQGTNVIKHVFSLYEVNAVGCCLHVCVVLIRLFRIISIPSKFCYFRPPDHVISMD
jgi:hypothetical protein